MRWKLAWRTRGRRLGHVGRQAGCTGLQAGRAGLQARGGGEAQGSRLE